jgi:hypothetical protein
LLSPFEAAAYPRKPVPFYRTLRFLQAAACALLIAASVAVIPASQALATPSPADNPDLTNTLANWVMLEEPGSHGSWSQVDATGGTLLSPISSQPILAPNAGAGDLYFVKDQSMPSAGVLYIPLTVPSGSGAISLSFDYFVQAQGAFAGGTTMSANEYPNQQFRVDILDIIPDNWFGAPSSLVSLVTPTTGSSNPATAWTTVDLDLTAELTTAGARGNTVYLAFREVDNQGFLTVGVDNVRFTAATVVPVLCDNPTTAAQQFACAISANPATVSAASVATGDAPPGMLSGQVVLGEPILSPPNVGDYGWSLFSTPGVSTPKGSTVPDPIDGAYHLFETGEPGATIGVEGTLSVQFTIPSGATMASINFAYFLQSGSASTLAEGQQFNLSYTSDNNSLGNGSLWAATEVTGINGNPWNWQNVNFFELAELSPDVVDRTYTLVFTAAAADATMQVGVDMISVYSDGRDATKKTFGVHSEELLAYPIQGANYGVMSTGDAASVTADSSQQTFLSAQFGGRSYLEGTSVRDLTRISMDLVPPIGSLCVSINVRFLSEEYPDYVGQIFNDIFLAELRQNESAGTPWTVSDYLVTAPDNFAVVPATPPDTGTTVLSINTTNVGWFSPESAAGTAFNGGSILLRATAPVDLNATSVELILSLFDQSDESYDTAVMLDALTFWPTADCSAPVFDPSPDPSASPDSSASPSPTPTASTGIEVVAPTAEWMPVVDPEVLENALPTLTLVFDQPVVGLVDADINNVGSASGCLFDVTPQNPSAGAATQFAVAVTSCGTGQLQPQLAPNAAQGAANNLGPAFSVTSFPIKILALGGGSPSPTASTSPSPTASASPSASPSGIALVSPTPSASDSATPSPSETASPETSPDPGSSPGPSQEPVATPSAGPTDSPIRKTEKTAVRVKDTAAGTRIYINERTSSSFIAASIPSIQQAISSPGVWFGGLLLSVLLAFGAILLEAPFDWIKRRIKVMYQRVIAYIEPKDRGSRLWKIFGIRVDVFPFLIVGQLIAALNAPLDAIPPLHQLVLGCVYGAIAALVIHALMKWPEIRLQRIENNDSGEMRAQWLSILLALGAVAIAQSFGFAPGLIVGIFATRHFQKSLNERGLAQSSWHLSLLLIAAALISWVGLEWVALLITDPEAPLRVISDMVLGTLVVAGSQGLIWTLLNPAEEASRALRHRSIFRWILALTAGTTMIIAILMNGGEAQGLFSPNATIEQLRGLIVSGVGLFVVVLLLHRFTSARATRKLAR